MDIKVFSNTRRLKLIVCLSKPHSVSQLLDRCDLSQSALSQHLAKLKDAGIITCQRNGNMQIYTVVNKKIVTIAKSLLNLIHRK